MSTPTSQIWNVTVTIPANTKAFTRVQATITYSDAVGNTTQTTSLQLPYRFEIKDVYISSAPTPDAFIIVDKNNGKKQWASSPLSTLVVQAGRPRLPAFTLRGEPVRLGFLPNEVLRVYVVPLADVGASAVNITLQIAVDVY